MPPLEPKASGVISKGLIDIAFGVSTPDFEDLPEE
jgi:hypothetical protein